MNSTRECYEGALKRLKHYLEDSINGQHCPDPDACHAGIDAVLEMETRIGQGHTPWDSCEYGDDTQDPDPEVKLTALVEADKYPVTLQRGYAGPQDAPPVFDTNDG